MTNALRLACLAALFLGRITLAQDLSLAENAQTIAVHRGDTTILVYNKQSPTVPEGIDAIYHRSGCLHPLKTPNGVTVTDMFPKDHPHQHGVFTAWVKTSYAGRSIDFWNLAKDSGRVLHERVVTQNQTRDKVEFQVDLLHRATQQPQIDILRERWKVTVHNTESTYHCIDLALVQTALTDLPLKIRQNRYGGFAFRGRVEWLTSNDRYQSNEIRREPSMVQNNLGSDRLQGNHQPAKWIALTGELKGQSATVAVLSHPSNFRAPQTARLHPTKPYFVFSPCVDGAFEIDKEHPFAGRYRILLTDAALDPAWLNEQWETWSNES